MQEKADECTKLVSELERVLPASALQQAHAPRSSSGSKQATQMLEAALLNMHDYFVHVAARVASLQEATEAAREAHLRSKSLVGHTLQCIGPSLFASFGWHAQQAGLLSTTLSM